MTAPVSSDMLPVDIEAIRGRFPILHQSVKDKPLVYLDSAASSQKPDSVIDAVSAYYRNDHANVHRGVHTLSERATDAHEHAREACRAFINAASVSEIIFVRGATEAINLVAASYGEGFIETGDRILVTEMEHHANIVPWQLLCERKQAKLLVVPLLDSGELDLEVYRALLEKQPKLVAFTHVSNALGTVNPVKEMTALAHAAGAVVLVDGAQAVPHGLVDVADIGCDFYAFSGHKMYAPTGIGVLYGREALLDAMPPWQGGGEMIREVSFERTEYNVLPFKFEAGTPHIAGSVGLHAAIEFMQDIGVDRIARHEAALLARAEDLAAERDWLRVIGTAAAKAGVFSFDVPGIHPSDVGMMLDAEGVAVRTGHHCAMPAMKRYCLPATVRVSFGVYNSLSEIDTLFSAVDKVNRIFNL